jgi:hypothetical protein
MTVDDMTWVWADEVMALVARRMRADGVSAGELARRAQERFGVRAESFERQMRETWHSDGVMRVHMADRLLVLVNCHLTDLPCYRAAMCGDLRADRWPLRGRTREGGPVRRPSARSRRASSGRRAP